jgi:uncharacterized protein (TIGR02118 family)
MFKLIIMATRKPGLSMDEFRDYYEKHHAVLVRKITPMMREYRRNYLTPLDSALAAGDASSYDCVTEAWFDSEADFQRSIQSLLADPEKTAALAKDEENLFDRSTIRIFTAVEVKSASSAR